ncbi:unnamed protein product [Diabrotica balteata]|uniref:Uncharacterized protein n=1 Tax=Diabrotica balteata TaxID=107213 RepID=A0A9N9SL98_DIABA|nr:unnamed protein product [Diabrotica balteata]
MQIFVYKCRLPTSIELHLNQSLKFFNHDTCLLPILLPPLIFPCILSALEVHIAVPSIRVPDIVTFSFLVCLLFRILYPFLAILQFFSHSQHFLLFLSWLLFLLFNHYCLKSRLLGICIYQPFLSVHFPNVCLLVIFVFLFINMYLVFFIFILVHIFHRNCLICLVVIEVVPQSLP